MLVYGVAPPGGVGEEFAGAPGGADELGRTATAHALSAAEAAGVTARVELVDAKPAEALVEVADRTTRVIVVGTWGESPLRGALARLDAHKLLHLADRPVLCVPVPRQA